MRGGGLNFESNLYDVINEWPLSYLPPEPQQGRQALRKLDTNCLPDLSFFDTISFVTFSLETDYLLGQFSPPMQNYHFE